MTRLERWIDRSPFYWVAVAVFRAYVRVVFGLFVHDAAKVPRRGGLVVACNHLSAWDPPVVGVAVPREIHFMAKRELFARTGSRWLMRGLRAFPVDRSANDIGAVKHALRELSAGMAIGIFAQGTRNVGDKEALDGASFLAQRAGVLLQPAAVWREGRGFHVRFGDPIRPSGRGRADARELTAELMRRVNAMLPAPAGPTERAPGAPGARDR